MEEYFRALDEETTDHCCCCLPIGFGVHFIGIIHVLPSCAILYLAFLFLMKGSFGVSLFFLLALFFPAYASFFYLKMLYKKD